jgi:hypothetical protein
VISSTLFFGNTAKDGVLCVSGQAPVLECSFGVNVGANVRVYRGGVAPDPAKVAINPTGKTPVPAWAGGCRADGLENWQIVLIASAAVAVMVATVGVVAAVTLKGKKVQGEDELIKPVEP